MQIVKEWPLLKAKTSTGKVKLWSIRVEFGILEGGFRLRVTHGQEGGKQIVELSDPVGRKNVGRANETTPKAQALAEAEAQWVKKKERKGYAEKLEDSNTQQDITQDGVFFIAMKAHEFAQKVKKYVKFPCFAQPKLNGVRMLARKRQDGEIETWSYGLKPFSKKVLSEIFADLKTLLFPGDVVDGEVYRHGTRLNRINGACKKRKPLTAKLTYHIFDYVVSCGNPLGASKTRMAAVISTKNRIGDQGLTHVDAVETQYVIGSEGESASEVFGDLERHWVKQGYEGAMYRSSGGKYQPGTRSTEILKLKSFKDAEFKIVGAEEGKNKARGQVVWLCVTPEGKTFSVRPEGEDWERQDWWKNRRKYIGKMLTVKYFEMSEYGIPQLPVGLAFREEGE